MLVLSRYKNESIILHGGPLTEPIEIMIVAVREDGRVRVGINAHSDIQIDRKEVLESPTYQPRKPKGKRP